MNAHNPFDAKQDWANPYCQNSSNDPMVDALLGNAYHVVRTVYCNLGNLKLLYDFLNQYGMVIGVNSEEELKALSTQVKYSRIYGFSRAGDRQVTDYLYVEGDRTGILPNDAAATGSWITVATSGSSGGGGTSSGEGAYIPWVYSNGSATGGETTINVPDGTVGVPFIIVNGDMQYVGRGFEFNVENLSVTLAQPLEEGDEVIFLLTGTPAVPDNPNVSDWVQINWLYNGGYASGGEQVIPIPYTFQSVPAIYKNGARYYAGLSENSYTADADNQRILLTEPLTTNDRLIVTIGGESETLLMSDRTIQEVARSANVKDTEIILSTNTTQYLNGKKVIYDEVAQKIYGLPSLPTNVYINSLSNGQLTYKPGNITVDLVPLPNSAELLSNNLMSSTGSSFVKHGDKTVGKILDTLFDGVSPLFRDHIKTLDYWAAKMHGGETVRITCYGDSTTDGNGSTGWTANPTTPVSGFAWDTAPVANSDHNAEAPNAWPAKLQTILRQYHRNNNISVYNAGYSGQQMQNGWANYYFEKAVLQNPHIPSNPDIVIIGFGLNDITDAGNKITQHIAQTIEVMKKVIAAGATPVLMTCDANWRSYNGWNSGSSGRDNEEAAAQIDAAKKYMSEVLGVSIIDQDFMQKTWMSKNSDYSNQYQLQPDGLHWGDTGHSMKAAFVAQSFMPDILRCYGTDIERICWMDSRMRYSKDYTSSWVPPSGEEGYHYSRFPRIWYIQAADYTASEVIFDFFVWSEGNQDSLIYRNFGNSNIGSAYAANQLPRVKVFSLGNSSAYYDKELPDTGENEAYINATDRPFYLTKLRYGLNRIQVIAPAINTIGAFWGGWFEFNPFWKAKSTYGYVNNYGAPNYVQVNALEKTGPLNFRFEANTENNRVAFMNPEMFDGTNCADIGQVGDKVEILVEGFFDTDTGFLFFGGKSLNRNSGSTDNNQEDNCLLLYATSKTFNLLQLRYPYQSSAPYPQIQTGIDDVYSATDRARKFLIRCEKTSPTTQTIMVYDGWETIDTPVLNYKGDWKQGKFCGGGIIGGVYATRNIARTVRISQLLIRKYK